MVKGSAFYMPLDRSQYLTRRLIRRVVHLLMMSKHHQDQKRNGTRLSTDPATSSDVGGVVSPGESIIKDSVRGTRGDPAVVSVRILHVRAAYANDLIEFVRLSARLPPCSNKPTKIHRAYRIAANSQSCGWSSLRKHAGTYAHGCY